MRFIKALSLTVLFVGQVAYGAAQVFAVTPWTEVGTAFVVIGGLFGWLSMGLWVADSNRRKAVDAYLAEKTAKAQEFLESGELAASEEG